MRGTNKQIEIRKQKKSVPGHCTMEAKEVAIIHFQILSCIVVG